VLSCNSLSLPCKEEHKRKEMHSE